MLKKPDSVVATVPKGSVVAPCTMFATNRRDPTMQRIFARTHKIVLNGIYTSPRHIIDWFPFAVQAFRAPVMECWQDLYDIRSRALGEPTWEKIRELGLDLDCVKESMGV